MLWVLEPEYNHLVVLSCAMGVAHSTLPAIVLDKAIVRACASLHSAVAKEVGRLCLFLYSCCSKFVEKHLFLYRPVRNIAS